MVVPGNTAITHCEITQSIDYGIIYMFAHTDRRTYAHTYGTDEHGSTLICTHARTHLLHSLGY